MKKRLTRIKEEAQSLCSEISGDLKKQAKTLERVKTPPFKNAEDFDRWFRSDDPLVL